MQHKFRVWCEFTIHGQKHKDMAGPESWFLLTQSGHLMSHGPLSFDPNAEQKHDKLVIEFWTGHQDKNGKDIYEGDIVRMNPVDDDWLDTVIWWQEEARFELQSFVEAMKSARAKDSLSRLSIKASMCRFAEDAVASPENDNPCEIVGTIHDEKEGGLSDE